MTGCKRFFATSRWVVVSNHLWAFESGGERMDRHIVIPIAIFLCITYAFKSVLDLYARRKSRESMQSPEMMRHAIDQEQRVQRRNALRWGIALVALSLASGMIGLFHLDESPTLSIAVLLGAAGFANLCYVAVTRDK